MKSLRMLFTNIFTYIYHQQGKHFVTVSIKTSHISENINIWSWDSTKETRWVNAEEPRTVPREVFLDPLNMHCGTLLLQHPTNLLKPSYASLFAILPSDISTDIDVWLSGLEHCNIFKHVILRLKLMCNPVLLNILMTYGLHIITSSPSVCTTKSDIIGHIYVFWIGAIVPGLTMNITQTNTNKLHR